MVKILRIAVLFLLSIILVAQVAAYDDKVVHPSINEAGTQQSKLAVTIKQQLGIQEGLKNILLNNKTIGEWIKEGGRLEDETVCRSRNHFHDPLKTWDNAGLNNVLLNEACTRTALERYFVDSSIVWAQNSNENLYSWTKAKEYYYKALTAKDRASRDQSFALTFRAVGQVMHLLSDTAVPAHVRNDIHVFPLTKDAPVIGSLLRDKRIGAPTYETWAQDNYRTLNYVGVNVATSVFHDAIPNKDANNPISALWDQNKYDGSNINVAIGTNIGLAEYTNANFFSEDTIFRDYEHPAFEDTNYHVAVGSPEIVDAEDGQFDTRVYIRKTSGEADARLAAFSYVSYDLIKKGHYQYSPFVLDDKVYNDYAAMLIPRAVGYSATLLDYFFRAKIRLVPDLNNEGWFLIRNDSDEKMRGVFSLYYDDIYGDRNLLLIFYPGVMSIDAHGQSAPVTFTEPADIKERGKYMMVFQGTHGAESGAVAGSIVQDTLEITPPGRFAYAVLDGAAFPLAFNEIRARVRNTDPERIIKKGSLQAIIQFKKQDDEKSIYYARSAPIAVNSLDAVTPAEYRFDFSADPVDISVNSVYLKVMFRGNIGAEADIVAAGTRDISEPTPIDVFNNMDKVCINGNWYAAGSQEAIVLVDTNKDGRAEEFDVYGHDLKDLYLKLAPADDTQYAAPTDQTLYVPSLAAGKLYRAYVLSEYLLSHSDYMTAVARDGGDIWTHTKAILKGNWSGSALRDQDEYHTKQAACAQYQIDAPCITRRYVTYFQFRGKSLWGAAGNIIDNPNYPPDTQCSWDALK